MYNLRILDIDRTRIAVIDRLVSWRYNRRPSEATEISVALPREAVEEALPDGMDLYAFLAPYQVVGLLGGAEQITHEPKHERAQVAHYVEIYRGTQHVVTGRISKRDIKDETISIQCHTEEIELERHVTPAQYGRKWDHWDLADVARDMLRGWHVQRVKDKTQWESAIDSSGIDTSTEPGVVMLAKSGGKYVSQGHITLRFAKADVPGFHSWDRIRWASDNAAPVRTTMQWRADGGSWSEEIEGALPDEIGVVSGTATADVIDVRINLYTEDTEAEDADGNPVGVTPYVFAVELIARTEGALDAGDIPASTGVFVSGLEADGASALNVLSQACEQAGWEFWVANGKLNIAKEMGEDRTASVLLRAGTNMTVQTLSEGDDELVNVLTAYGPGEGINRLQVTRRHEESIAKYGEYRGVQTFEGATTLADLIDAADAYLDEHAAPVPAFRVDAHYPYGTEPEFGCGDYVRVADPRNGIITRSRIAEEVRSYSTSGLKTTLYLGLPAPNLARQVRPTTPPRPVQPPDKPVISVSPIPGGIRVVDTKAPNIRWSTSEVHMSTAKGFVPSAETLVADGRRVRFDIGGLTPDMRYYVRLIRYDTDGVPSEPSDEMSAVAGWFGEQQVDPELFSIKPTSDPAPLTGKLESLWDMDPATGCTFESAPTITYKYPVDQGSDMVRVHISGSAMGYVQMRAEEGHWIDVAGSAADPLSFQDGWNVKRFTDHKLYFGREYRIVFLQNVKVNELKFWRVTLADEILAQVVTLTDELRIANEDRSLEITDRGMRVESADGATIIRPGGIVFEGAGGRRTGYVRSVQMGTAEDGEDVPLPFQNDPIIILSPAHAATYHPDADDDIQKLELEALNVRPEGFTVWAKLVKHTGAGQRITYPKTEVYQTQYGGVRYCSAGAHKVEASEADKWSPHEVRSVGETVVLTTPAGTTEITVRMREMLHVHAYAARNATNRITYRVRARVQGSDEWVATIGPITKSISVAGGLLTEKKDFVHRRVSHVISNLAPAVYEVQLEITDKQQIGAGSGVNNNDSCYLIVEEMETRSQEAIELPEPILVHYVAFESDSAVEDDDSTPED